MGAPPIEKFKDEIIQRFTPLLKDCQGVGRNLWAGHPGIGRGGQRAGRKGRGCGGAPSRNRTGTASTAERFSCHFGFRRRAAGAFVVWTLSWPWPGHLPDFRPPPSSLCTFRPDYPAGFAQRCLARGGRGFVEFDGIHAEAFAPRCSNHGSKSLVSTNSTMGAVKASGILAACQRIPGCCSNACPMAFHGAPVAASGGGGR